MTISTWTRRALCLGIAAASLAAAPAFAQKTKLTVYTALENDQLGPLKKAFEADNPTIEIAWVRDSTGVVAATAVAACGKLAQEDVRLPVTDSFFFLFSAGAGAYRSAAASSMPCSSVCQNRSPLARRDSALSTRGDDQAYQLRSSIAGRSSSTSRPQSMNKRGQMSVRSHID